MKLFVLLIFYPRPGDHRPHSGFVHVHTSLDVEPHKVPHFDDTSINQKSVLVWWRH